MTKSDYESLQKLERKKKLVGEFGEIIETMDADAECDDRSTIDRFKKCFFSDNNDISDIDIKEFIGLVSAAVDLYLLNLSEEYDSYFDKEEEDKDEEDPGVYY